MKENNPDDTARIREQAIAIANELGAKLSALGIPFICIVGIPGESDTGDTLRLSRGLEKPEVNLRMRLEVEKYADFMEP